MKTYKYKLVKDKNGTIVLGNGKRYKMVKANKKIQKINLDFSGTCTSEELHKHTKILLSIRDLDEMLIDKINEIIDKINGDK